MRKRDYHPYIDDYIDGIRSGAIPACKELKQAMDYVEQKLDNPDVIIRGDMIDKAVELIEKYFEFKLFNWELFILALIHCYYKSQDAVVFDEIFIMMGRGNGKNGFISALAWYLTTHYHGIRGYNVDIIANSEDQAKTSFMDVYEVLERTWTKSQRFFYKSK
ncbi:MAG: terminase large subunit, partial [Acutalibacteraceae bacterium]